MEIRKSNILNLQFLSFFVFIKLVYKTGFLNFLKISEQLP